MGEFIHPLIQETTNQTKWHSNQERGKLDYQAKNLLRTNKNQQTQPIYDAESGIETEAKW